MPEIEKLQWPFEFLAGWVANSVHLALSWSALKKPSWKFNFFHIFAILSSSRHTLSNVTPIFYGIPPAYKHFMTIKLAFQMQFSIFSSVHLQIFSISTYTHAQNGWPVNEVIAYVPKGRNKRGRVAIPTSFSIFDSCDMKTL